MKSSSLSGKASSSPGALVDRMEGLVSTTPGPQQFTPPEKFEENNQLNHSGASNCKFPRKDVEPTEPSATADQVSATATTDQTQNAPFFGPGDNSNGRIRYKIEDHLTKKPLHQANPDCWIKKHFPNNGLGPRDRRDDLWMPFLLALGLKPGEYPSIKVHGYKLPYKVPESGKPSWRYVSYVLIAFSPEGKLPGYVIYQLGLAWGGKALEPKNQTSRVNLSTNDEFRKMENLTNINRPYWRLSGENEPKQPKKGIEAESKATKPSSQRRSKGKGKAKTEEHEFEEDAVDHEESLEKLDSQESVSPASSTSSIKLILTAKTIRGVGVQGNYNGQRGSTAATCSTQSVKRDRNMPRDIVHKPVIGAKRSRLAFKATADDHECLSLASPRKRAKISLEKTSTSAQSRSGRRYAPTRKQREVAIPTSSQTGDGSSETEHGRDANLEMDFEPEIDDIELSEDGIPLLPEPKSNKKSRSAKKEEFWFGYYGPDCITERRQFYHDSGSNKGKLWYEERTARNSYSGKTSVYFRVYRENESTIISDLTDSLVRPKKPKPAELRAGGTFGIRRGVKTYTAPPHQHTKSLTSRHFGLSALQDAQKWMNESLIIRKGLQEGTEEKPSEVGSSVSTADQPPKDKLSKKKSSKRKSSKRKSSKKKSSQVDLRPEGMIYDIYEEKLDALRLKNDYPVEWLPPTIQDTMDFFDEEKNKTWKPKEERRAAFALSRVLDKADWLHTRPKSFAREDEPLCPKLRKQQEEVREIVKRDLARKKDVEWWNR